MTVESDEKVLTGETAKPPVGPTVAQASRKKALIVWVLLVVCGGGFAWAGFSWWNQPRSLDEIEQVLAREEWSKAEKWLRLHLDRHPSNPSAMLLLGRCLGARGALGESAELLEQVPNGSRERRDALLGAGLAWKAAHHRRDAERVWRLCLHLPRGDLEPASIERQCVLQLCEMYALERRKAELWSMLGRQFDMAEPRQKHEPLAMRARYLFEMVDPPVALGVLSPAIDVKPDDYQTRRAIGLYHLAADQLQEARAQLFRCVQEEPDDLLVWEAWCTCLHTAQDLFGVERAVAKLPESADSSAVCWKFRAIVAEQQGKLDQAVPALRRAIEIEPTEAELHYRLGQLLVRTEKLAEGEHHLNRNKELQETNEVLRQTFEDYRRFWATEPSRRPTIAYQFGAAYERLGEPEESRSWYRAALSENPAHAPSIAALERSLVPRGAE